MMLAFIQNLGVLGSVPVPWPGTLRCTTRIVVLFSVTPEDVEGWLAKDTWLKCGEDVV